VELSIDERLVHSCLLDLIVEGGYLVASPDQQFERISSDRGDPEGIDSLLMSATLLRKEDNKLMHICNEVRFVNYDSGWVPNFEDISVKALPIYLYRCFDYYQEIPVVSLWATLRNPIWQTFAALDDVEYLCGFGNITFKVTLGKCENDHVGQMGTGLIDDGGITILRLWQNYGVWV
jgi:hypothetical protein